MAPPPSQDEALSRYSASGEVPRSELEVERALGTLDATHKVPRNPGLPREEHGLKLNIQKTKIMASGPITSWQIDGETMRDFIFLGSKITADGDCSHEIKRCLLLGIKAYDQPRQHIKKQKHYFANKGLVKAMVFPVVMYRWESWTIKKAKCLRIDAFELWCWRRLLRVPWTARRSNQSTLKEISPEYSLEVLMLKVKLQYFGHLRRVQMTHWKRLCCWERLKAGERDDRGWMRWLDGITDS